MSPRFFIVGCVALLAAFLALAPQPPAQAQTKETRTLYFTEIPDLPVPPGFTPWADGSVVFESGPLRIIEVMAWGAVGPDAENPLDFYARALPGLGWQAEGKGLWHRDHETLRAALSRQSAEGPLWLRIHLGPPEKKP